MKPPSVSKDQYAEDLALTLRNRSRLAANPNLLYWYRELYKTQFAPFPDPDRLDILEIGSGVSPLKLFRKNVKTSDILELDYLDYVFDCHIIDRFEPIAKESLDVIAITNVLHHLRDPIDFLERAASKLKRGGKIVATEPYFSTVSTFIYKHLHHEAVNLTIAKPVLEGIQGPLASANIALPWLIFFRRSEWSERLRSCFDFDLRDIQVFSSLSYMATGGISRRLPVPRAMFRALFHLDLRLSRTFPKLLPSFFTIALTRK